MDEINLLEYFKYPFIDTGDPFLYDVKLAESKTLTYNL